MLRRLVLVAVYLASLALAVDAVADEGKTSSLSWVELPGAEGCGGAAALAHAVEERLGRHALVSPAQADLSIEGHAERTGDPPTWRAVLLLRSATGAELGKRELQSAAADCTELRADVALAVALMIDPEAALRPTPAPSAPPAPRPDTPLRPAETPSVPGSSAPATPWRAEPSASLIFGAGFLPSVSGGARLGVTVAPPHFWPVELFGGAWAAQTVTSEQGTSTRFTSTFAGLALCPLHVETSPRFSFDLCGGGLLAVVGDVGSGFSHATSESEPTLDAVVDGHVRLPVVGPLAVHLGGTLAVAVFWNDYIYEDSRGTQSVFSPSRLAAAADAGLAVAVP